MSTTTIHLPHGLKNSGADFLDGAEKRFANIVASGKTIPWNKMRAYLEARLTGKKATRPAGRTLTR